MVEYVEGICSKLEGCAFTQFGVFEQPHIPDVDSWRFEAVASEGWNSANLGHDVVRVGFAGNVTCHAAASARAANCKRRNAGGAAGTHTHKVNCRTHALNPGGVQDAAVARGIAVSICVRT